MCHGRVAGRTRETRCEVNKQSFNDEHRIHYHIDELTDKDSGKTQGLWTHNNHGNQHQVRSKSNTDGDEWTNDRKQEGPYKGVETQGKGRQSLTLPPPSNRRVPRRTTSKGEGGWALWRPQGPGDRTGDLQGGARSGTHGGSGDLRWPWRIRRPWRIRGFRRPWRSRVLGRPWRIRGFWRPWRSRVLRRPWRSRELGMPPWRSRKLGRPWRIGELRWPWRVAPPPNFLGEAPHLRGALRSRGRRAGQGQRRERWAGRDQRS